MTVHCVHSGVSGQVVYCGVTLLAPVQLTKTNYISPLVAMVFLYYSKQATSMVVSTRPSKSQCIVSYPGSGVATLSGVNAG